MKKLKTKLLIFALAFPMVSTLTCASDIWNTGYDNFLTQVGLRASTVFFDLLQPVEPPPEEPDLPDDLLEGPEQT